MTPDFAHRYHSWMIIDAKNHAYAARYNDQLLALAVDVELDWTNRFAQAAIAAMALEAVTA